MKLNKNDVVVRADSIDVQTGPGSSGEIDLYGELIAFAELSPEEQAELVARQENASAETKTTPGAEEHLFHEPDLTQAPIEPVQAQTVASEIEAPSAEDAQEGTSPEPEPIPPPIEPVEPATAVAETQTQSAIDTEELTSREPVQIHKTIESVESGDAIVSAAVCASDSVVSEAFVEPGEVRPRQYEGPRPSGPLSGFNLPPNIVYTGALSKGVCLACGAESGADDLFCMTCGVFIDEIASTLPADPTTCAECKQGIAANEIFCPWCGSVLSPS